MTHDHDCRPTPLATLTLVAAVPLALLGLLVSALSTDGVVDIVAGLLVGASVVFVACSLGYLLRACRRADEDRAARERTTLDALEPLRNPGLR